ncbi:response regulator transcription factor [Parapedobacter sp. ISTM3]|uniref:Two component transcriptional regulator, LytTR family n=1 Tax=Parapedobacter luteus TaxID=623280 RepID=A0A1T5EVS7_9SPHI|nr:MULTISPECIES: LytTR family DNA-binding domain-containing protein [Parapedobacter]MBK1441606.1 response regulator transcription factor [Parapedobacter sp. ISTM3]SKB87820.1 two component transcriptional regulator, LytTR family [Parapedobacter luteus]
MMDAVIIDDEEHCVASLRRLLLPYQDSVRLVGTFATVDEAVMGIGTRQPDIVFMDVQLGESGTAFDVLNALGAVAFNLIFTTAYDQYAVQAFRFAALDYLLKPIAVGDFANAMNRVFQRNEQQQLSVRVAALLDNLSGADKPKKMGLPTADGYEFVDVSEVVHCRSDVNYTHIFTVSGQKYTVSKTLKHFEELLGGYHFFRIHHSHLINLDYVVKYVRGKGGAVVLANGVTLEVSSRRKDEFLARLKMK